MTLWIGNGAVLKSSCKWQLKEFRKSILHGRNYLNFEILLIGWLVIFVHLSSLWVAHLSDAPRRRLVVTGDSARIQDETAENSACFFNVLGV